MQRVCYGEVFGLPESGILGRTRTVPHLALRVRGDPKSVEIVGPGLHHRRALREILRMVVETTRGISHRVRELPLDRIGPPAELVEERASGGPEAVRGHLPAREP